MTNKESLEIGRIATVAIAITAAISALAVDNIISGLLTCYAVWTPAILPSLILGLWLKKPRPLASILSMSIGATVSVFLWVLFIFFLERSVDFALPNVIIPGLVFSVLAYLIGHFWKQSKDIDGV